jgi:threonine/homoserine efflux transporter RhtA
MAQPALAATVGWLAFGETLGTIDVVGMVLLAVALAMARAADKPAKD